MSLPSFPGGQPGQGYPSSPSGGGNDGGSHGGNEGILRGLPIGGTGDHLPIWLLACCGAFTAVGMSCLPQRHSNHLGTIEGARSRQRRPEYNGGTGDEELSSQVNLTSCSYRGIDHVGHAATEELPEAGTATSCRADHGHVSQSHARHPCNGI